MSNPKIALITGANRGIGLEVARQLAALGHQVILSSRDEEKGRAALASIQQNQDLLSYHQLDVTDAESVERIKNWILNQYGRLDILVNNAGVNYDTWHQALNANLVECHETIEANLFGPWNMCQAFLPIMQSNGFGRVVNVSSGAGALTGMGGGTPAYSISKAALNVLTIKLAAEVRGDILINAVCPGWVRTDMGGSAATRSVAEGASGIIWAATLNAGGPNGGFFRDGRRIDW